MRTDLDVLVIGGGAIGICSAYYLAKQGLRVSVVEKGEIASGCSGANAGLLVPSHCIPLASPGVLRQGFKSMIKPESPFYIRPRFDPGLFSWLWQFRKACKLKQMQKGIQVLRDLNYASLELFDHLIASESLSCNYRQDGWLLAYKTEKGFQKSLEDAQLLQTYDIELKIMNADETSEMEPTLNKEISGGIYFPGDCYLEPAKFVQALAERLRERGINIHDQTEVVEFETSHGRVTKVLTNQGDLKPEQVVLAAGAWSPGLVKAMGLRLPVQPAKGYSISIKRPETCPHVPLYFSEAKVAVTPLEDSLRFSGRLELVGMDFNVSPRRVKVIIRAAQAYMREIGDLDIVEIRPGLRPCSPDGLPIIDRFPEYGNLIVATGHGMLGITLAPVTGKLISQLACEQTPDIDLSPFRATRFK